MDHDLMPGDRVTTGLATGVVIERGARPGARYVKVRDALTGRVSAFIRAEIDALRKL